MKGSWVDSIRIEVAEVMYVLLYESIVLIKALETCLQGSTRLCGSVVSFPSSTRYVFFEQERPFLGKMMGI